MSLSFALVCLWVVAAWALSLFPSKGSHWPLAYVLIAVGVPLLVFVAHDAGPVAAVLALAVGCLVLRWPVRYLWRWIRRTVGPGERAER